METVKEIIFVLNETGADWAQFICPKCGLDIQTPNGKDDRVLCPLCRSICKFNKYPTGNFIEND